jgi:hypothetical protein
MQLDPSFLCSVLPLFARTYCAREHQFRDVFMNHLHSLNLSKCCFIIEAIGYILIIDVFIPG